MRRIRLAAAIVGILALYGLAPLHTAQAQAPPVQFDYDPPFPSNIKLGEYIQLDITARNLLVPDGTQFQIRVGYNRGTGNPAFNERTDYIGAGGEFSFGPCGGGRNPLQDTVYPAYTTASPRQWFDATSVVSGRATISVPLYGCKAGIGNIDILVRPLAPSGGFEGNPQSNSWYNLGVIDPILNASMVIEHTGETTFSGYVGMSFPFWNMVNNLDLVTWEYSSLGKRQGNLFFCKDTCFNTDMLSYWPIDSYFEGCAISAHGRCAHDIEDNLGIGVTRYDADGLIQYTPLTSFYESRAGGGKGYWYSASDILPATLEIGDGVYFNTNSNGTIDQTQSIVREISFNVTAGGRSSPWVGVWEYHDGTSFRAILGAQDTSAAFTKRGEHSVSWPAQDPPPRVVSIDGRTGYYYRLRITDVGAGTYTPPRINTIRSTSNVIQIGLDTLSRSTIPPNTTLGNITVYIGGPNGLLLPVRSTSIRPSASYLSEVVTASMGELEPVHELDIDRLVVESVIGGEITTSPGSQDVGSIGLQVPLLSDAFSRSAANNNIPIQFFYTLFGFGVTVLIIIALQFKLNNILISIIGGGCWLAIMSLPGVGVVDLWVLFVYGMISAAVIVIGRRVSF